MSTGQMIFTVIAFVFLSTIMLRFYSIFASSRDTVAGGQDGILATSINASYIETAKGLSFDAITDTSDIAISNASALTPANSLGPEGVAEDSIQNFDDFDDFNNFTIEKNAPGTNKWFKTRFAVHYVNMANAEQISNSRTFLKRLDLTTWRTVPPPTEGNQVDTLKTSIVMGYFHFN